MMYLHGQIVATDGTEVPITQSISTSLSNVDVNFGKYNYINLTTGEAQQSGYVDGNVHPVVVVSGFVGMDSIIQADAEYIASLQEIQNAKVVLDTSTLVNLVIAIENGIVNASNGVSRPAGDAILWAKSPIPASFAPGMYIDVSLPTQTSNPAVIVSVDYKLIGPNNEELTPQSGGITVSRLPNTNTLRFQSSTTTWQNGGYIAVTYKE